MVRDEDGHFKHDNVEQLQICMYVIASAFVKQR